MTNLEENAKVYYNTLTINYTTRLLWEQLSEETREFYLRREATLDLIFRLRKRAQIRRSIPRGEPDRIADLLEEAANAIEGTDDQRTRPT